MRNGEVERGGERTARDLLNALFRHKKKMAAFSLCVAAAVAALILCAPRKYESTASLFFRIGRQSVALDPSAATGPTIAVNDPLDAEINSALEVIQSRELADRVVTRLGLDAAGSTKPEGWLTGAFHKATDFIRSIDPVSEHEAAVNELLKSLTFSNPKQSRIINIRCKADSPEYAHRVVAALVEEFLDAHIRLNQTEGSHEFFEEQTRLVQEELGRASQALRDLKNEIGVGSIEAARTILANKIQGLQTDRWIAEANVAAAEGRLAALAEALKGVDPRLTTDQTAGFDNVAADQMRSHLYELELREKELAARYTDVHPLVVAIRKQVEEARKVVDAMQPGRTHQTTTVNPTYQQLELDRLRELASIQSNRDRIAALDREIAAAAAEQKMLNEREIQMARLTENVEQLSARHHAYSEKLEQSRVDRAVNEQRICNVNVAQHATLVLKPVSPNKLLIAALGVFIMLFGSVGLALVCEYLDESLRTPDDVEACLQLPVLLSIPRVRRRSALLN